MCGQRKIDHFKAMTIWLTSDFNSYKQTPDDSEIITSKRCWEIAINLELCEQLNWRSISKEKQNSRETEKEKVKYEKHINKGTDKGCLSLERTITTLRERSEMQLRKNKRRNRINM